MQVSRHYYVAQLKNWKWNAETNNIDEFYDEVEKDFTAKQLKNILKADKWSIFGFMLLGVIISALSFIGSIICGLICTSICGLFFFLLPVILYLRDHYHLSYRCYLGEQDGFMEDSRLQYLFLEEIAQRHENKLEQEKLAAKWRKKHPLEEKIRMAITGNPNYVADLLRYCELVKSHSDLKQHIDKTTSKIDNNGITVKYINSKKRGNK